MNINNPEFKKQWSSLYGTSLSMLTDLYQLTMAYGYWRSGSHDKEAVFYMSFRKNPFQGGFAIACGLTHLTEFIKQFRFDRSDVDYLATLSGDDDQPLFHPNFLEYLLSLEFSCDLHAVTEGTVVFAHEPIVRISGPIIQCQLLESALLNIVNFQTLIATKAARVVIAASGKPVIEFGLRRAQGIDGALSASYASYIGGCTATSNTLAGKLYGIPIKGTHSHSWVMSFGSELEAFEAYADAMPNNCVFLVDTYDTLSGVKHAIKVGEKLRARGFELGGIRLDSGDLAYLSIESRYLLDQAGFKDAQIIASNDLDENVIQSLNDQSARIDAWGVGTKLSTAYDQPALGGVYKLSAIRKPGEEWQPKLKLSEQAAKISTPGISQIRRYSDKAETYFVGDMVYEEGYAPDGKSKPIVIIDPMDFTRRKKIAANCPYEELLVPIFEQGNLVYQIPQLTEIKGRVAKQLARLHPTIKRLLNPHQYPVGLEQGLHQFRTELILETRENEREFSAQASDSHWHETDMD